MAIVQLLGCESDQLSALKSKSTKKKQLQKKDSTILNDVSQEVQAEEITAKKNETEISLEKPETSPEKSAVKFMEQKQNTEVEAFPAVQVAQEKTESVVEKTVVVPTETNVVPEELKAKTNSDAGTEQKETDTSSEKAFTEENANVKKTD